jgi:hypothetical protein
VNVLLNLNEKQKEFLQRRLEIEVALLDTIKGKLPELERVQVAFGYEYEDGLYSAREILPGNDAQVCTRARVAA